MWVIYTQNCRTTQISHCCYTTTYEKALNALDDYAIAKYRLKDPDFPADKSPIPLEGDSDAMDKDGYYLRLDMDYLSGYGDSERVNLFKVSKGEIRLLRYFQIAQVEKYVDDYLAERTQAVIDLEKDCKIHPHEEVMKEEVSSDEDGSFYSEISSDEFSDN